MQHTRNAVCSFFKCVCLCLVLAFTCFQIVAVWLCQNNWRWRRLLKLRMVNYFARRRCCFRCLLWNLSHGYYKNESFSMPVPVIFGWLNNEIAWMNLYLALCILQITKSQNIHTSPVAHMDSYSNSAATDQCIKRYSNAFAYNKKPWTDNNDLYNSGVK